jgi:aryl-alcohol dehydrogenase-like predicted oxidoreductase
MTILPTRQIGNTEVTAMGYGAMGIAAFYGAAESDEERLKVSLDSSGAFVQAELDSLKFFDGLYESGCTNWDTADCYNDSERIIGQW